MIDSSHSLAAHVSRGYADHADRLLAGALAAIGDAVVVIDADLRIIAFNAGAEQMFGYTAAEVLDQPLAWLLPFEARSGHVARVGMFRREGPQSRAMAEDERIEGLRRDGSRFAAEATVASMHLDGEWAGVAVVRDVSAQASSRKALLASLEQQKLLAHTDALTGLWNRRALVDALDRELSRLERGDDPFTLVYIDLDHFKIANDRHGHVVGDRLLVAVADRLRAYFRAMDFVARVGGDEFVVLAPISASSDLHARMQTLCDQLRADMLAHHVEGVTFSIGALTCAAPGITAQAAIHAADTLMYRVKRGGRNGVCSGLFDEHGLRDAAGLFIEPMEAVDQAREA